LRIDDKVSIIDDKHEKIDDKAPRIDDKIMEDFAAVKGEDADLVHLI